MDKSKFKIKCVVYESENYDEFKIMEKGNREVDHYKRIVRSMKEQLLFTVIFVNENMEILDGQNRFFALKEIGAPINFIILDGYRIKEARKYNVDAKNWTKNNFIKSYADEGNEDYIQYQQFAKKYHELSPSSIEFLLQLSASSQVRRISGGNTLNYIQNGLFKIKDIDRSCQVADWIMAYKGLDTYGGEIYKRREFAVAIIKLSRIEHFDNDEVIRKIKLNPRSMYPCLNSNDYIKMIEDILNFKKKGAKIRFDVD